MDEEIEKFVKNKIDSFNKCAKHFAQTQNKNFKITCEKYWNKKIKCACSYGDHQTLHLFQDLLLSNYSCKTCQTVYWSFCDQQIFTTNHFYHCLYCNECNHWKAWHCERCNKCIYGEFEPCDTCGGKSADACIWKDRNFTPVSDNEEDWPPPYMTEADFYK
eukprot:495559_1